MKNIPYLVKSKFFAMQWHKFFGAWTLILQCLVLKFELITYQCMTADLNLVNITRKSDLGKKETTLIFLKKNFTL